MNYPKQLFILSVLVPANFIFAAALDIETLDGYVDTASLQANTLTEGTNDTIWQTKTENALQPTLGTFDQLVFNLSSENMDPVEPVEGHVIAILSRQSNLPISEFFTADDDFTQYSSMLFIWVPANLQSANDRPLPVLNPLDSSSTIYVSFYLLPNVVPAFAELPEVRNYSIAALTGFVDSGDGFGGCVVVYGDGFGNGVWQYTDSYIELGNAIETEYLWNVYKLDTVRKRYDFFLNGVLIAKNVPFIDNNSTRLAQFEIDKNDQQEVLFDQLSVSYNMPTGLDYGDDQIQIGGSNSNEAVDSDETQFVFSDIDTAINDSVEMANGHLPISVDAEIALYVDCAIGSDSYNGLSAEPGEPEPGYGPKASITAAFNAAKDSDVILLESGTYHESILDLKGKNLTLYLNGPVTID